MRPNPRPLALLLSVGLMTGCAVGPDYRTPELDISSRFLGQEGVAHRDVQRIHRSIEPGFENGDLRLDLSQRTFDLANLQLGGDALFELKLDRGE